MGTRKMSILQYFLILNMCVLSPTSMSVIEVAWVVQRGWGYLDFWVLVDLYVLLPAGVEEAVDGSSCTGGGEEGVNG